MEKQDRFELIKRTLGIKHKLKVYDSVQAPANHEEMAQYLIGRWELEDELAAIERALQDVRDSRVAERLKLIRQGKIRQAINGGIHKEVASEKTEILPEKKSSKKTPTPDLTR